METEDCNIVGGTRLVDALSQIASDFTTHIDEGQLLMLQCASAATLLGARETRLSMTVLPQRYTKAAPDSCPVAG
jgi:hypothetical protein